MSREGRLADVESLRRIERLAIGWTAVGATVLWVATPPVGGGAPAGVLTGVAAASIVSFRGLQRIVSAMGPADPTLGSARVEDQPKERAIGWRQGLAALVRLCLLGALLIAGSLLLPPRFFPALVLGFSTLPAALMTEGLLQSVRALRGKDHDGFS